MTSAELVLTNKRNSLLRRFKLAFLRYYRTGENLSSVNAAKHDLVLINDIMFEADLLQSVETSAYVVDNIKSEVMKQVDAESQQLNFIVD